MKSKLRKKRQTDPGSTGLPCDYPTPPKDRNLLFYIQRNLNHDTIVYHLNRNPDGLVNKSMPMHAHWIKYSRGGEHKELNKMQTELAYGYRSREISDDLFSFQFVSYADLTLYIVREDQQYSVQAEINGAKMIVKNMYVYAQEFGVFPDVKFVEFYGLDPKQGFQVYEKIFV